MVPNDQGCWHKAHGCVKPCKHNRAHLHSLPVRRVSQIYETEDNIFINYFSLPPPTLTSAQCLSQSPVRLTVVFSNKVTKSKLSPATQLLGKVLTKMFTPVTNPKMALFYVISRLAVLSPKLSKLPSAPMGATKLSSTTCKR